MAFRSKLRIGVGCVAGLLVVVLLVWPDLVPATEMYDTHIIAILWAPTLLGLVLTWAAGSADAQRELDVRTARALSGHPLARELLWLLLFLVCFLVGSVLLSMSGLLSMAVPDGSYVPVVPVVRILFLFVLPVLLVDLGGFTVRGHSTAMPALSLRVTEGYRWLGAIPVAAVLALVAMEQVPGARVPPVLVVLGVLMAVVAISTPEEIFFRGMVQTRLEQLFGRWRGILLGAVVFAVSYAVVEDYTEAGQLPEEGPLKLVLSLFTYGVVGVLYGYVWSRYRNIWLSVALRGGMLALVITPTLDMLGS